MSSTGYGQQPSSGAVNQSTGQSGSGTGQTQKDAQKPSLTGVRIKQRKRQAQASAKFEPEVFRDSLLSYLHPLPASTTPDTLLSTLVTTGTSLELLKYSDAFFELFFCGGLLQPGGGYLDPAGEGKRSNVAVLRTRGRGLGDCEIEGESEGGEGAMGKEEDWKREVRELVDVLKRLIQRYKYLQKPLDEHSLASLIAYIPKWAPAQRERLAYATAHMITEGLVTGKCLQSLWRDGVVKDEVGLQFMTIFIKSYFSPPSPQTIDSLSTLFRKSQLDSTNANFGLLNIFPNQVRNGAYLESHFKKEGLGNVVEWYNGAVRRVVREEVVARLGEMMAGGEGVEDMADYLRNQQAERTVPETDMLQGIWTAIMTDVDWTAKPEQLEGLALKNIKTYASLMEPFCSSAKAEVGLINIVQAYCYTETRIMKAFPQILKLLYNADCISDQAIIYWAQKGAVAQGKGHFVKAAEPLVQFLQAQEDDDDEDEE